VVRRCDSLTVTTEGTTSKISTATTANSITTVTSLQTTDGSGSSASGECYANPLSMLSIYYIYVLEACQFVFSVTIFKITCVTRNDGEHNGGNIYWDNGTLDSSSN